MIGSAYKLTMLPLSARLSHLSLPFFPSTMPETITLRPAQQTDVPALARVFLAGVAVSLPHRNLADLYDYERDISAPEGRLWVRITTQLVEERVVVAEEEGRVVGYVCWTEPKVVKADGETLYQPGEVGLSLAQRERRVLTPRIWQITFLFLDPSVHGRGLGSRLIVHVQAAALAAAQQLHRSNQLSLMAQNDKEVVLGVFCFTQNQPGIRAYRRRGFVSVSAKVHEPSQEELTWMEWRQPLSLVTA